MSADEAALALFDARFTDPRVSHPSGVLATERQGADGDVVRIVAAVAGVRSRGSGQSPLHTPQG